MECIKGSFGEKYVGITAGRADIESIDEIIEEINVIDEEYDTVSQIFDASKIFGKNHLLQSSKLTLEALEDGETFANSPAIELTCWTAGSRQINKSLERVGVKEGSDQPVSAVTIGDDTESVEEAQEKITQNLKIRKDEKALEVSEEKIEGLKKTFSITEKQLEVSTPEKIVLEQIALLSLEL